MSKKLKFMWSSTAVIMVAVVMAGCCSIICGTSQEVAVSSNPGRATVKVNGQIKGKTPVTLDLKRNKSHRIRIELDGYQPYGVALKKRVNAWVLGNIIFGGIIGLVIDAVDGAIYTIKPDTIQAILLKDESAVVSVDVQKQPTGDLQKIGQMEKVGESTAERLKELKDLKDNGILTEDEYETKRKELVDQL